MGSSIDFVMSVKVLQPGFLVIFLPSGHLRQIQVEGWDEMKRNGWSGGLVLDEGVELESYTDSELAERGLMRIPAKPRDDDSKEVR